MIAVSAVQACLTPYKTRTNARRPKAITIITSSLSFNQSLTDREGASVSDRHGRKAFLSNYFSYKCSPAYATI